MRSSRSGRPSLIGSAARTAGRTAIIAGTATVVVGAMSGPKQRSAQPAAAQPAPAAPTPVLTDDKVTQLQKLAELQQTGVLSDEEFANLKAQILAS
jgi:hypothetical protein